MELFTGDYDERPVNSNLQELIIAETQSYFKPKRGKGRPRTSPSSGHRGLSSYGQRRTRGIRCGKRRVAGGSRTPTNRSDVDIFKILKPERRPYTADSVLPEPRERRNRRNRYKRSGVNSSKKQKRAQAALQMQK